MLKGWSIPQHMEWLFWPIGFVPTEFSVATVGRPGDTFEVSGAVYLPVQGRPNSLERRFTLITPEWNDIVDRKVREIMSGRPG